MEGTALANAALLRSFTSAVAKEHLQQLSTSRVNEICIAIVTKRLVGDAQLHGASMTTKTQLNQSIDQWIASLVKALQQADEAPLQHSLTKLLAATATVCDAPRLLLQYQSWLGMLLDKLKQQRDALSACGATLQTNPDGNANAKLKKRPHSELDMGYRSSAASPQLIACIKCSCMALTSLFTRLGDYMEVGGVRRETSSLASRACGLALSFLSHNNEKNNAEQAGSSHTHIQCAHAALSLITGLMTVIPASLRNHASSLEMCIAAAVTGQLPTAQTNQLTCRDGEQLTALAAAALAALPRVSGDASSYSNQFRRLLLSLNEALDVLFMGLEDANVSTACKAGLIGIGTSSAQQATTSDAATSNSQSQPSDGLLPIHTLVGADRAQTTASKRIPAQNMEALALAVHGILATARLMLVGPYNSPVTLPCGPLLQSVSRIVSFNDATILSSGRAPPSTTGFQKLQMQLPRLHVAALQLAQQLLASAGSSMMPHSASLGRLLCEQLRHVHALGAGSSGAIPAQVRTALLQLGKAACEVPGGGLSIARTISHDALGAIRVELYGWLPDHASQPAEISGQTYTARSSMLLSPVAGKPASKKAKLAQEAESVDAAMAAAATAAAAVGPMLGLGAGSTSLIAGQAALELLGALVAVAGPLLPASHRATADAMSYHIAASTMEAVERTAHEPTTISGMQATGLAAMQLAAYQTLLVTLLTPLDTRPPFLSQAIQVFAAGRASRNAAVAAMCLAACTALESLLHPRSTPITGVRHQYAGLQDVQELHKPKMWSSLLAAEYLSKQPHAPAVMGTHHGSAQPVVTVVPPAADRHVQHAHVQHQQPQQQLLNSSQPIASTAPSGHIEPCEPSSASANLHANDMPQQQGEQKKRLQSVQKHYLDSSNNNRSVPSPSAGEHVTSSAKQQQQGITDNAKLVAGNSQNGMQQQGQVVPTVTAAVGNSQLNIARPPAFGDESSDSEGSLPDIDMGDADFGGSDNDSDSSEEHD